MKNLLYFISILSVLGIMASCNDKKAASAQTAEDSIANSDPDTTIYGVCGDGTSMHSLQLITDKGDTITYEVEATDEEESEEGVVKGGLLAGDRLAVLAYKDGETMVAQQVINLTSLEGKWTDIARSFEIINGGEVKSAVQTEDNPYTSWKIHNGKLLMGRDTFTVCMIGADSLLLDNGKGIFAYKRQTPIKK